MRISSAGAYTELIDNIPPPTCIHHTHLHDVYVIYCPACVTLLIMMFHNLLSCITACYILSGKMCTVICVVIMYPDVYTQRVGVHFTRT